MSPVRNSRLIRPVIKWFHEALPDRYMVVRVLGGPLRGRRLSLNLRYQMGYWLGLTEPDVARAMAAIVLPGEVVYDVGAEVGYFSVMAATISRSGPVYAFEPNPANLAILEQTALLNKDLDLRIVPKAVGDTRQSTSFLTFANKPGVANASLLGRLAEVHSDDLGDTITVDMVDLDSFSEEATEPDVIKIDVEGAEALVLRGMRRLLTMKRPKLIIEIHNESAQHEAMDCLAKLGYRIHSIGRTYQATFPYRVLCMESSHNQWGTAPNLRWDVVR